MNNPQFFPKIAIIGAGLAGLTAAYYLQKKQIPFDIYEARNRVGGRILTIFMQNYLGQLSLVELGGQNITDGGLALHLLKLIDQLNLKVESKIIDFSSLIYFQGAYHNFHSRLKNFFKHVDNINKFLDELSSQCYCIGELLNKLFFNDPILKVALRTRMTAYEGIDVDQQSIHHNIDTLRCMLQGGIAMAHETYSHQPYQLIIKTINGGNAKLPLHLAQKVLPHLHLNKILYRIEKNGNKFQLFFQDNITAHYDFLILAIPASTYKNIQIDNKVIDLNLWQVMQKISYGSNFKIVYPLKFIPDFYYPSITTKHLVSFFNYDQKVAIFYLNRYFKNLNEKINNVCKAYQLNKLILSQEIQTAKDSHYKSYLSPVFYNWQRDIYSKGSYSGYSTVLSTELDETITYNNISFKKIFQPYLNRLFFIGEHTTILDCIGTMEAAIESGERIAKFILMSGILDKT